MPHEHAPSFREDRAADRGAGRGATAEHCGARLAAEACDWQGAAEQRGRAEQLLTTTAACLQAHGLPDGWPTGGREPRCTAPYDYFGFVLAGGFTIHRGCPCLRASPSARA